MKMSIAFKIIVLFIALLSGLGAAVDATEKRKGYLQTFGVSGGLFVLLQIGEKIVENLM